MTRKTEMVEFPDGSEEPRMIVNKYFCLLMDMAMTNPGLLRELLKKCRNDNHPLSTIDDLSIREHFPIFLDGVHPAVKKIILALVTEDGDTITVSNPFS